MALNRMTRKELFGLALSRAGLSRVGWARLHRLSHAHVTLVLDGQRESKALDTKIDSFIATHVQYVNAPVARVG